MLEFLYFLGFFIGGPVILIATFFLLPKIFNRQLEDGLKFRAKKRRDSLEEREVTRDWEYLSYFQLPLDKLKLHLLYFLHVEKDLYLVTNPMKGQIFSKTAHIFDFQRFTYVDKGHTVKSASQPVSILLIDVSPQKVNRFWFSKTNWADTWRRQNGTLPGIIAQDFTIHGIDKAELKRIFTPSVIDHYQGRNFDIEGGNSFLLLAAHTSAGTKESFITLIQEGEYALKHLLLEENVT